MAAESSETVATSFIRAIEASLQPLSHFPLWGPPATGWLPVCG
ncbi:hypothetical protein [Azospirillum melinis]